MKQNIPFLNEYFTKNNTPEDEQQTLTDACDKTVHYILNEKKETEQILSAEKMKDMIGIAQYVSMLIKSCENGHAQIRHSNKIIYFETESSVYARTLLEQMNRKIILDENISDIKLSLKNGKSLKISISKQERDPIIARLINEQQEMSKYKKGILVQCETICDKKNTIQLAKTIKQIIAIDEILNRGIKL